MLLTPELKAELQEMANDHLLQHSLQTLAQVVEAIQRAADNNPDLDTDTVDWLVGRLRFALVAMEADAMPKVDPRPELDRLKERAERRLQALKDGEQ